MSFTAFATDIAKKNAGTIATGLGALIGSLFPKHTVLGKLGAASQASLGLSLSPAQQEANAFNKQMQDSAMTFNAQQAEINRNYQTEMSNTAYQRQVADMQKAGVNPALAMSGGAGASTPSGGAASAGAASSVSPSSNGMIDMIIALKQLKIQEKLANADVRLKGAEAKKAETEIPWIDRLNELEAKSRELANNLTDEQIKKIDKEMEHINAQIKKTIQETDNEVLKGMLIEAQTNLAKLDAKQKVELLPYQKALLEAQTEAQKAQASLAFAQAAIQKGLFDSGYVEKTIEGLVNQNRKTLSEAELTEAKAGLESFIMKARTGQFGAERRITNNPKIDKWLNDNIFGALFGSFTAVAETVISPLRGIL